MNFNKLLSFFTKTKCYVVPSCPHCNSAKTGRYIFMMNNSSGVEKVIASYMKKGELIKPILGFKNSEHPQFFCEDCGAEWFGEIFPTYVTKEELEKIKNSKGITKNTYNNMKNFKNIHLKKVRAEKKAKRKEKRELYRKSKELKKVNIKRR